MLIKAGGVVFNMTAIRQITVSPEEEVTYKRVGFFKREKQIKSTWKCELLYKNMDGDNAKFTWWGGDTRKEVELEHMSASLENAIRNI